VVAAAAVVVAVVAVAVAALAAHPIPRSGLECGGRAKLTRSSRPSSVTAKPAEAETKHDGAGHPEEGPQSQTGGGLRWGS
jgi:hypothetical protein